MFRRLGLFAALMLSLAPIAVRATDSPHALLVCNGSTFKCPAGTQFKSIQAAVDAASPGDWVLVWPGVYHEKGRPSTGVLISKPDIHLRGLDRNLVIVDGSNGPSSNPCPSQSGLQDFTPRDGIEVFKVNGDSVENLTVCNYMAGVDGHHGNQVWFNGGDGSGNIGMGRFTGTFLTATSEFAPADNSSPMAQYGIFASNASGPGRIADTYASNMGDSSYYVGACQQVCHTVLERAHAQNSSIGFSGTNAGNYVIRDSEWDQNRVGLAPNSLNNDDAPPPQNGLCPGSTTESCTFIEHNWIHDNNNPNVPTFGLSPLVGAGIEISGGHFDTIRFNRIDRQGSWGVVTHEFPDTETPPALSHCQGGVQLPGVCLFIATGNRISSNVFSGNGFFGNPTNGDLANESTSDPRNCFFDNHNLGGSLTSDPADIQSSAVNGPPCGRPGAGDSVLLLGELQCASDLTICQIPSASYPQQTQIKMLPLRNQRSMEEPCEGTPENAFCEGGRFKGPQS